MKTLCFICGGYKGEPSSISEEEILVNEPCLHCQERMVDEFFFIIIDDNGATDKVVSVNLTKAKAFLPEAITSKRYTRISWEQASDFDVPLLTELLADKVLS